MATHEGGALDPGKYLEGSSRVHLALSPKPAHALRCSPVSSDSPMAFPRGDADDLSYVRETGS